MKIITDEEASFCVIKAILDGKHGYRVNLGKRVRDFVITRFKATSKLVPLINSGRQDNMGTSDAEDGLDIKKSEDGGDIAKVAKDVCPQSQENSGGKGENSGGTSSSSSGWVDYSMKGWNKGGGNNNWKGDWKGGPWSKGGW